MSSQEVTNVSLANTNKLYFVYYECYLPKKKNLRHFVCIPSYIYFQRCYTFIFVTLLFQLM